MKKLITMLAFVAIGYMAQAQIKIADIKGDYCEFTKVSAFGKEAVIIYVGNEMQRLQNDEGVDYKFSKFGSAVAILNAFVEKGWILKLRYEENRGGSVSQFFLMERKK